jgi:hypothetical protein
MTDDPKLKASPRQRALLAALSATEWRKVPPGTLGPTIVALWNRDLIEGRLRPGGWWGGRYADSHEWRLTCKP